MAAEEYFYVLLWQQRWALAAEYATRMATRLEELKLPAPEWIERAGDAGFFAGDYGAALGRYEESLRKNPGSTQAYLRLSDAWFRLGDIDQRAAPPGSDLRRAQVATPAQCPANDAKTQSRIQRKGIDVDVQTLLVP